MSISSITALGANPYAYATQRTQANNGITITASNPFGSAVSVNGAAAQFGLPSTADRNNIIAQAKATANQVVATRATGQVNDTLNNLQSIATRAANSTNASEKAALNTQFQQGLKTLNSIATNTKGVDGTQLLAGGSTSTTNTDGSVTTTTRPDYSAGGLFGSTRFDLSTADGANNAIKAVQAAQKTVANGPTSSTGTSTTTTNTTTSPAQVTGGLSDYQSLKSASAQNEAKAQAERRAQVLSNLGNASRAQTGNFSTNLLGLLN